MLRADPIVLLGPTATGKSEIGIHLARRLGGRIISADSMQVYRGLDAGTCKPSLESRREIPHELIDVADPVEAFSAGRFARLAMEAIDRTVRAGLTPIIVGGTGLYIRALLSGIAPMPARDEKVRRRLYDKARRCSAASLHQDLAAVDPSTAARLGPNDLQRVVRALEVIELTGIPLSGHIQASAFRPEVLPALKVGLTMDRKLLDRRIEERVDRIFELGIVDEVRHILAAGVPPEANAFKALGYREVIGHLRGEIGLDEAIALVKRNTRRYARRQLQWFRREPGVHWLDVAGALGRPEPLVEAIVELHRSHGCRG